MFLSTYLNRLGISTCLVILSISLAAQSQGKIDPAIIASSGGLVINENDNVLLYTIGDIATEYIQDGIRLSEGFHNTFFFTTPSKDEIELDVTLYPNPTTDKVVIKGLDQDHSYRLLNQIGQLVKSGILSDGDAISFSNLTGSVFHLQLYSSERISSTIKVIKI